MKQREKERQSRWDLFVAGRLAMCAVRFDEEMEEERARSFRQSVGEETRKGGEKRRTAKSRPKPRVALAERILRAIDAFQFEWNSHELNEDALVTIARIRATELATKFESYARKCA